MMKFKLVERLDILPLAPPEAARFSEAWQVLQGRFVDNPKGVVVQAERLVRELMEKRGYPMGDFERRAGDISVDHPEVVAHYRARSARVGLPANQKACARSLCAECAGVFSHSCKAISPLLGENDDREMQKVAKLHSYKHETVSIQIAICR